MRPTSACANRHCRHFPARAAKHGHASGGSAPCEPATLWLNLPQTICRRGRVAASLNRSADAHDGLVHRGTAGNLQPQVACDLVDPGWIQRYASSVDGLEQFPCSPQFRRKCRAAAETVRQPSEPARFPACRHLLSPPIHLRFSYAKFQRSSTRRQRSKWICARSHEAKGMILSRDALEVDVHQSLLSLISHDLPWVVGMKSMEAGARWCAGLCCRSESQLHLPTLRHEMPDRLAQRTAKTGTRNNACLDFRCLPSALMHCPF